MFSHSTLFSHINIIAHTCSPRSGIVHYNNDNIIIAIIAHTCKLTLRLSHSPSSSAGKGRSLAGHVSLASVSPTSKPPQLSHSVQCVLAIGVSGTAVATVWETGSGTQNAVYACHGDSCCCSHCSNKQDIIRQIDVRARLPHGFLTIIHACPTAFSQSFMLAPRLSHNVVATKKLRTGSHTSQDVDTTWRCS